MIEVELPDGTIAEFPDGTARETIQSALQTRFGAAEAKQTGQGFGNNLAQAVGDGVFMGLGDEISARLNAMTGYDANTGTYGNWGTTYADQLDAVRGQEKQFRKDHPVASIGAEIAGSMAVPGLGVAGGVAKAGSLPAKMAAGAAAGAVTGGAYGFNEGEGGFDQRMSAAVPSAGAGSLVGWSVPAVGSALQTVMSGRAARKTIKQAAKGAPTSDELRAMGNALYRQIDDAGVQVKPEAFSAMRQGLVEKLRANTGYDELPGPGSLTPNTARVMQIMDQADATLTGTPTAALPFRSLDQMRRQAGAAAGNVANKTDQRAGMAVIEELDGFVQRLGPNDVAAGDVQALQTAIPKAREIWSRMSRSQLVDDAMERSDNYLSGSASGLRNQFKNILQNKKLAAQFTPAEKAAMRMVTHGGPVDQLVNLMGGGLAQLGSIGGGFALGGPVGAAAGAGLAMGQRKLAEVVTARSAERARAAIAGGQLRQPEALRVLLTAGLKARRLTEGALFGALPSTVGQ